MSLRPQKTMAPCQCLILTTMLSYTRIELTEVLSPAASPRTRANLLTMYGRQKLLQGYRPESKGSLTCLRCNQPWVQNRTQWVCQVSAIAIALWWETGATLRYAYSEYDDGMQRSEVCHFLRLLVVVVSVVG